MNIFARILFVGCLGTGAALPCAAAGNEGGIHVEAGYTQLSLSGDGISLKPANALVRVGYDITSNFSAELVGTASVASDSYQGVSFKVDNGYGAFLKGQSEILPKLELFARAGWMHTTLTGSFMVRSASASDSSFAYGVGVQYRFTKNWYGQMDYASYYDKGGDSIRGPSISFGYRF